LKNHFLYRTAPGFAILLGLVPGVCATEAISFEQAVEAALRGNPELASVRFLVEEAEGRLHQRGQWPNPELDVGAREGRLAGGGGDDEYSLAVAQRFPLAGRLKHAREVGRFDVALARAEVQERERVVAGEARMAFADVVAEQEQIALQRRFLEQHGEFLEMARNRMETAEVSVLDLNQAEADVERLRQEIRRREARLLRRKSDLHFLMGREGIPAWSAQGTLDELVSSWAPSDGQTAVTRPDLDMLLLEASRAGAESALARAEARGDARVALGLGQEVSRGFGERERDTYVGLSVTLPVPVFDRGEGAVSASRAARSRHTAAAAALRARIETERRSIVAHLETLGELRRGAEEVLMPRLEANAQLLAGAYAEGQISMTDLLQMQERLYRSSAEQLDLTSEIVRTLAELQTLLGANHSDLDGDSRTRSTEIR
jgi:outer membrane protein, heavy metal efflux system